MTYAFISQVCPDLPVATCCRVMKVSTSGFYAWKACPVTDRECDVRHGLAELSPPSVRYPMASLRAKVMLRRLAKDLDADRADAASASGSTEVAPTREPMLTSTLAWIEEQRRVEHDNTTKAEPAPVG
jgi:hypothetical protein